MGTRTVWAYQPLEALGYQVGFVAVDEELAARLLETGEVQDVNLGQAMKPIKREMPKPEPKPEKTYKHKELTAEDSAPRDKGKK